MTGFTRAAPARNRWVRARTVATNQKKKTTYLSPALLAGRQRNEA
jgi:hypothetical protein